MGTGGESPGRFFLLVLAVSIPFWVVDGVSGGRPDWLPINLPLSALMAVVPALAALVLTYWKAGAGAARSLALRAFDIRKAALGWLLLALLLYPLALLVEYLVLLLAGRALPDPAFEPVTMIVFLVLFFVGGVGEELGWQGYAYPALEERWNALGASLIIATFWAAWHVVPFMLVGREPGWIVWQCAAMFPLRIITVWLFLNAGRSVFVAACFHAMGNVAQFLFPRYGSHYDPFVTFVILSAIAIVILIIWQPGRLERLRSTWSLR